MSYVESNLVPGEKVIYETRLHWTVMISHVLVALVFLDLPGAFLLYYALSHTEVQPATQHILEGTGAFLLLLSTIVILMGVLRRNATEMAVTNRRVVVKTGLANRKTI